MPPQMSGLDVGTLPVASQRRDFIRRGTCLPGVNAFGPALPLPFPEALLRPQARPQLRGHGATRRHASLRPARRRPSPAAPSPCPWSMLQADAAAVRGLAHATGTGGRNGPLAVGRRADHAGRAFLRDRPLAVRPLSDHAARAVLGRLDLAAVRPLSDAAGRTVPRRINPVAMGRLTAGAGRALLHYTTAAPAIPGQARRAAMAVAPCLSVPAARWSACSSRSRK